MRHTKAGMLCLISTVALAACEKNEDAEVTRALKGVNVIDETNLNDIMLTVADPNEGVAYFSRALEQDPDRIDLQRGLGKSLIRAGRATEGAVVWGKIVSRKEVTNEDRIDHADALIRIGDWKKAEGVLDSVPPTHETYRRYRLEAMIADSNKEWRKADSFYETAVGLTTKPGSVLNNWGYSKLTRGEPAEAERLFMRAVEGDPDLFTAKNNLALARGAQRIYELPLVPMNQIERAQLLHTIALSAVKQGDVNTARALFKDAVATHPQHFDAAARALATLEGS